jgi:ribosomal-protein-alanine N-acetyltransferase
MGLWYVLDEGYITNVATAPEHRRRGVASALIAETANRAQALGLAFLTLEVRESNMAARMLYAKHGFAAAGYGKGTMRALPKMLY